MRNIAIAAPVLALIALGQVRADVPAEACWKYDSAGISASEVERWNDLAAEWDADQCCHRLTWFDSDRPNDLFHHNKIFPTPRMASNGQLAPVWKPGFSNKHASLEERGCSAVVKGRTLIPGRTYRGGFRVFVPAEARTNWETQALILQHHPTIAPPNPAFSILYYPTANRFRVHLRADDRPKDQFHRPHQFEQLTYFGSNVAGKWHEIEYEVNFDLGSKGRVALWHNRRVVVNLRRPMGYVTPHTMAHVGLYVPASSKVPMTGMLLDQIWFMAK